MTQLQPQSQPQPSLDGQCAGFVFRVYMGGSAIVTWYTSMSAARSPIRTAAASSDGAALIWLLLIVGAAAIFDAVINDLLPRRFHCRVMLRQRHFILASMAFCYVAQMYVAFYHLRSTGLLIHHLWSASMIMLAAFFDAHQRSKAST